MAQKLSPTTMLTASLHAQPGVYAVLLGSGVSTGAGIPTGWGIVRDLVAQIAVQDSPESVASAQSDPETWWAQHQDEPLGYSSLLEALAPTPAARQGLLAGYFTPTDDDRESGNKLPSPAHRAIARMVKSGYVRVIVTTNFDRLMEQALEAEGVSPQVISRPDAVRGMEPLVHARATVIKLHGDYKDLETRNTESELSGYPEAWNALITEVFDNFGLIISGWSADWDHALVSLLENTPNRRYPLYWDLRSARGETAQRILAARSGQILPAASADELFQGIVNSLEALERLAQPPLTTAMAVARLKRYLPDPVRRIELNDLLMDHLAPVIQHVSGQPLSWPSGADGQTVEDLFTGHLEATRPLLELVTSGVWHDRDGVHQELWLEVIQRLTSAGTEPTNQANPRLLGARLYPALLVSASAGLVGLVRNRDSIIIDIANRVESPKAMGDGELKPAAVLLHPQNVLPSDLINEMPRWQGTRWKASASHLLRVDLREIFSEMVPADSDYRRRFDALEYRLALTHVRNSEHPLYGEYVRDEFWGGARGAETPPAEEEFRRRSAQNPAWVTYFGGPDELNTGLATLRERMIEYRRQMW